MRDVCFEGVNTASGGLESCSWPVSLYHLHIPGDRNAWGDFLSRWVRVPALPVRAVAVFSPCDQDNSLPSKAVVRQAQQKALATDGTEVKSFVSVVGLAVLDNCLLYTSPSPRDKRQSRMPSSA